MSKHEDTKPRSEKHKKSSQKKASSYYGTKYTPKGTRSKLERQQTHKNTEEIK